MSHRTDGASFVTKPRILHHTKKEHVVKKVKHYLFISFANNKTVKMSKNLNIVSASGSATGNPRNKTALKPGYSLVGWIRLGSSGEDLTGLKGKTINVSHQELSLHNKREDCWMAVRGRVYNVTRYLDFHPGGSEQLMRGAGIDATKLFDEFHAWVNIDQLLSKCYVGPLRNTVTLNLKDSSSNMDIRTKLSPPSSGSFMKFPSILSASSEALSKTFGDKQDTSPQVQPIEIIPRFDWIQKTSELSIFFYTKSFCNPGVSVENICDSKSEIKIYIANTINSYKFSFLKSLKWPCNLKINQETGSIIPPFILMIPHLLFMFLLQEKSKSSTKRSTLSCGAISEYLSGREIRTRRPIVTTKLYLKSSSTEILLSLCYGLKTNNCFTYPSVTISTFV